jgi:glycerol-1-phosphate dehydrogenase [NAD(P)+]
MSADAIKLLKTKIFDKSKWMQLPRDVVIGHDVLGQIPSVCEDLKLGKSALLISEKVPWTSPVNGSWSSSRRAAK